MALDFCYAAINERLQDSYNSVGFTCTAPEVLTSLLENVVKLLKREPHYEVFGPKIDVTWLALSHGQLYTIRDVEVMLIADCKVSVP